MNIKLKLEYPSAYTVTVFSINKLEIRIHKNVLEISKNLIDLAIKKLKNLNGQTSSSTKQ